MNPYMQFDPSQMADRYRQQAMQQQLQPSRGILPGEMQQPSPYRTSIAAPIKTGPYEAPEAHPGAGGVTGDVFSRIGGMLKPNPGEDVFSHMKDMARKFAPVPGATNPGGNVMPPTAGPKPDQSAWDTDNYAKPGYIAQNPGNVLPGWDAAKWADQNHQTPKYVVGRILAEAGNLKDPAVRAAAIEKIKQAYPGSTFDGKDALTIPGVGTNDIFRGADVGRWEPQWLGVHSGADGGQQTPPMMPTATPGQPITTGPMPGMDNDFFQKLMARLNDPNNAHLMNDPNQLRAALMAQQMGGAQ